MAEERLYCYTYRLPGTSEIIGGWSNRVLECPDNREGFLISPFMPHSPILFIPADARWNEKIMERAFAENTNGNIFSFPDRSTTREEHRAEVDAILSAEKRAAVKKVVAARAIVKEAGLNGSRLLAIFRRLCDAYPSAFVFMFSTPESGTWVGASPELLLKRENLSIESMALAGTRPAGSSGNWDSKNQMEQVIVTSYISKAFESIGLDPVCEMPVTRPAGPVEHLMTRVHCDCRYGVTPLLLDSLSPTPALCGMPREKASEIIARNEHFDRAFYGGFCGAWRSDKSYQFFVNLRSAWLEPHRFCLMVGGGIVPQSEWEDEWIETERKASTIMNLID